MACDVLSGRPMKRLSYFPMLVLGIACGSADLYEVELDSVEVTESSLQLSIDRETSTLTVSLDLRDPDSSDNACPALATTIDFVILADGEEVAGDLVTRGGGDIEVDCAFKCRDLVALAAECTPAILEVSGPGATRALEAAELTFQLRDGEATLTQAVPHEAGAARLIEFPEGNIITLRGEETVPAPGVGTTPLRWSHPDDQSIWASEWRSGAAFDSERSSAFEFSFDVVEQPLLLRALGLSEGEHTVFVGSTTPLSDCSFRACSVNHVASATVLIEHR